MNRPTAARRAKELGLDTLKELQIETGYDKTTLYGFNKRRPVVFDLLCIGLAQVKKQRFFDSIK